MKPRSLVTCAATMTLLASVLPSSAAHADIIPIPGDCGPSSYSLTTFRGEEYLKRGSTRIPMTPIDSDEANPLFTAEDQGNALTVELWRGASDSELDQATLENEAEMEALAAASVDEAIEIDEEFYETPEDEVIPVESTSPLVTFALAVESDGSDAVAQRSLLNEPTVINGASVQAASSCGSGPVISSMTLTDPLSGESFQFPAGAQTTSSKSKLPTLPTIVKYKTFIPPATAYAPICGTFRGDNRSWSSTSTKSRSQVRVSAYFSSKRLFVQAQIGTTYKLDSKGKVIAKKTASSKGIKYSVKSKGSTYMNVQINHAVKNPLCSLSGPIRYTHVIELYPRGGARISGTLNRVPSHEAYVYYNGKSKKILGLSHRGFTCLVVQAPWCGIPANVRSYATIR